MNKRKITDMNKQVLDFVAAIMKNDVEQDLNTVVVASIVESQYIGSGQFSWDGIYDRIANIIGYDKAANILSNC